MYCNSRRRRRRDRGAAIAQVHIRLDREEESKLN